MWIVSPSTSKSFVRASSPRPVELAHAGDHERDAARRGADREDVHDQRVAGLGSAHRDRPRRAVHVREVEVGEDVAHELILARDLTVEAVLHRERHDRPRVDLEHRRHLRAEGPDHLVVGDAVIDGERAHGYLRSGNRRSLPSRRAPGAPSRPRPLAWRPHARLRPPRADRPEVSPSRRRSPRIDRLEPARFPRHGHARGPRGRRLRRRGDARDGARRGRARAGAGRRLAPPLGRASPSPAAPATMRRDGRGPADAGRGRARAARRRRQRRAAAPRPPRRRRAHRVARLARPHQPRRARSAWSSVCAEPRASILNCPEGGPVLPVAARARLVRVALARAARRPS